MPCSVWLSQGREPLPLPLLRSPPGPTIPRSRELPEGAEPLPLPLFGSPTGRGGRHRDRAFAGGSRRNSGPAAGAAHRRDLAPALGALSLDRQRGADLLRIRLGVAPPRSWVSRGLPRSVVERGTGAARVALPLAPLPTRVRRRAHQDARRSLLARSDLPLLPPGNAADAEPALLVLPPSTEAAAPDRGARKPLRPAGGAGPALPSPAVRRVRGARHGADAVLAGLEREFLLAEPHHHRPHRFRLRRSDAGSRLAHRARGDCAVLLARCPGRRGHRAGGRALVPARPQSRLPLAGDERELRSAPAGEHVRRLRKHRA